MATAIDCRLQGFDRFKQIETVFPCNKFGLNQQEAQHESDKRQIRISEELYQQVWQTPMSKLAEQYGISDNGLAKICRKLKDS
ncbi:MAG: hypothetical protein U5P41_12800 [Gammaproteobacteria bacterium]|nr:hypothetical protein [Gammaproteobacteria bacterium]